MPSSEEKDAGRKSPWPILGGLGGVVLVSITIVMLILAVYWDTEPGVFDINEAALKRAGGGANEPDTLVNGYRTAATLIELAETLLEKPGGYLSNDITPPSVFMDNMANWEFGALVQLRDMARVLRNDISRSQTQSIDDVDLQIADPQFHFDSTSWILPASESEYRTGIEALERYLNRLQDPRRQPAYFYTRADNLREWLIQVEKRLGSVAQRLSASVGRAPLGVGSPRSKQEGFPWRAMEPEVTLPAPPADSNPSTSVTPATAVVDKTPWLELDDIFYEARGTTWTLLHLFTAVMMDFGHVLEDKNALVSMRQIIRELEASQEFMWSPMVLNGSSFGLIANHSMVMGSYISRANSAIIDLRQLLERG